MKDAAHQRNPDWIARHAEQTLAEDLRRALDDAGLTAGELAHAARVDSGFLTRILRGTVHSSLRTWARLAAPLGLDLAARLYPNTGPAIRDRRSAPMLEHLLATTHPRWEPALEVRVTRPGRGWNDVVLHEPREHILVAGELQSELRRLEQLIRWQALKADSLPSWAEWAQLGGRPSISRLLVVRRTRATRQVAAEFGRQLRVAYPARPDDAIAAIKGSAPWPGDALAWMIVDGRGTRWATGR